MKITVPILVSLFWVVGCGSSNDPVESDHRQSSGGIWSGSDSSGEAVQLLISETGDIQSYFFVPDVTEGPTFGAGTLEAMSDNSFIGILQAKGIQPSLTAPPPVELSCNLSGTVEERQFLSIDITCSDDTEIIYTESVFLSYGSVYEEDSDLEMIAGNYTLPFRSESNILNINSDGTLFGMYYNEAKCTVNGAVSIIDSNYNLYGVEWTLSNCIYDFSTYDGVTATGFAWKLGDKYAFVLSGITGKGFDTFNLIFEPI